MKTTAKANYSIWLKERMAEKTDKQTKNIINFLYTSISVGKKKRDNAEKRVGMVRTRTLLIKDQIMGILIRIFKILLFNVKYTLWYVYLHGTQGIFIKIKYIWKY